MKRQTLILLAIASIMTACHKDDTQQPSDKRLAQIASSTYINEHDNHTQGDAGRGDVIWQDSTVVSFCGEAIEYNDDTISIYYAQGNLKRRAFIRNGRITRINTGDLYTGSSVAPWFTLTYNQNGEIESVERMCTDCVPTTTTFVWENGNLVQAHEVCLNNWNSNDNTYSRYEQYTYYTYDNKHTPWVGLENYWLLENPESPWHLSKNNVTSVRTITINQDGYHMGSGDSETETHDTIEYNYRYVYHNEYPILREVEEIVSNWYKKSKEYYIYKDGTSANVPQFCTITVPQHPENADACGRLEMGGGKYEYGATVILSTCQCRPVRWSDGSTDNPHSVIARGDATYTVIYTDK